jgi:hypothetical protein
MREKWAKKGEPVFSRDIYKIDGSRLARTVERLPACTCNHPVRKTKKPATVCGNCGGAILTRQEKLYLQLLKP